VTLIITCLALQTSCKLPYRTTATLLKGPAPNIRWDDAVYDQWLPRRYFAALVPKVCARLPTVCCTLMRRCIMLREACVWQHVASTCQCALLRLLVVRCKPYYQCAHLSVPHRRPWRVTVLITMSYARFAAFMACACVLAASVAAQNVVVSVSNCRPRRPGPVTRLDVRALDSTTLQVSTPRRIIRMLA
jgi:hypothetical protein